MIQVENLVKRFGTHIAVDHLSFTVEKGKIYGFLGPNGAGKSTTMNMMTGYIAASEGSIKINGHDIMKEPEDAKKCIGYLPETPPLYQDMTVKEYLTFVAHLKKISKAECMAQIDDIMNMTMIQDMGERLIKNLSKGYKQRVGLAQAIIGYPDVIILDEPTVGLDPKQIIEIRDLIKKLRDKHTIILSSHILSEVQAICDEIMIISKGKLVASDTPEGLTHLISGSASLELNIKGTREEVEPVLCELQNMKAFQLEDAVEADCVKVIIKTDKKDDIRTQLFYKLAENNMPIMSMIRLEKSLEDIFLELTEENTADIQSYEKEQGETDNDCNL